MKKIYWLIALVIVLVLLSQSMPIQAQDITDTPLYIQADSEILVWDGTELASLENPACRELGSRFAPNESGLYVYATVDQAWYEAEREPFGGGVGAPTNILLCSLVDGAEPQFIATQPETYFIKDDGHPENFAVRSDPTWSPDGTQIAWTEFDSTSPSFGMALVVYDVATQTRTTVAEDIPEEAFSVGGPVPVYWSTHGIVAQTATFNEANNPVPTFILIDPESGEKVDYQFTPPPPLAMGFSTSGESLPEVQRFFTDSGVVILYEDASWQVLYWEDGTQAEFTGQLARVSAFHPDGLQVRLNVDTELAYHWTVATPEGKTETLDTSLANLTISPDGTQLAYIKNDVIIWKDGEQTNLELGRVPTRLWWSTLVWQIVE